MIITIHQPNFLPWVGLFHKLAQADAVIWLDHVQFTKHSYQNRVQIRGANGPQWLTVPVLTKERFRQATTQVMIDNRQQWASTAWKTIQQNYRRAPHFEPLHDGIKVIFQTHWEYLIDLNLALLEWAQKSLELSLPQYRSSEFSLGEVSGSDLLLELVQRLGARTYLSGPSGRTYLDLESFRTTGIDVEFHSFEPVPYRQLYDGFEPRLSIIDLLFNCGPEGARQVLQSSHGPISQEVP